MMVEKVILLAEDDPGHEAMFRRAVSSSGVACRLDVVHDGTEVLDYLFGVGSYKAARPRQMPDLLLLDLKMPKMDGLQVLQVLRRVRSEERPRFPPVVVLTSSDMDDDIAGAYRWGAQSYIRKPPDFDGYSDAVRETLHYWLGLNQPAPSRSADLHYAPDI
jgi:two-component system, response regulator